MSSATCSPWPSFTPEEAQAVSRVLLSNRVNYWTGTECREFEREFAAWVGTEHAVALTNGTLALEVALKTLGVAPGDDVVVTPRSFIASASCVVTVGARPVFVVVGALLGGAAGVNQVYRTWRRRIERRCRRESGSSSAARGRRWAPRGGFGGPVPGSSCGSRPC